MLDLKAHQLGDLAALPELFDKFEVCQVLDIVLEGGKDQIEQAIRVQLEVSDQLLNILFDLADIL